MAIRKLSSWATTSVKSVIGTSLIVGVIMMLTGSSPAEWWSRLLPEFLAVNVDTARWYFLLVGAVLIAYAAIWPRFFPTEAIAKRISLIDFAKLARDSHGWKFDVGFVEIDEFLGALCQAHTDKALTIEGSSSASNGLIVPIRDTYFRDGGAIHRVPKFPDCENAVLFARRGKESWRSLHLSDKATAVGWLAGDPIIKRRDDAKRKAREDRSSWLRQWIEQGEALERAALSGTMLPNWSCFEIEEWEHDVLKTMKERWPQRQVAEFKAASEAFEAIDSDEPKEVLRVLPPKLAAFRKLMSRT